MDVRPVGLTLCNQISSADWRSQIHSYRRLLSRGKLNWYFKSLNLRENAILVFMLEYCLEYNGLSAAMASSAMPLSAF